MIMDYVPSGGESTSKPDAKPKGGIAGMIAADPYGISAAQVAAEFEKKSKGSDKSSTNVFKEVSSSPSTSSLKEEVSGTSTRKHSYSSSKPVDIPNSFNKNGFSNSVSDIADRFINN
jgi:hypothetical protein